MLSFAQVEDKAKKALEHSSLVMGMRVEFMNVKTNMNADHKQCHEVHERELKACREEIASSKRNINAALYRRAEAEQARDETSTKLQTETVKALKLQKELDAHLKKHVSALSALSVLSALSGLVLFCIACFGLICI